MSAVVETSAQRFDEDVLRSPVPVLVDFWAPWCGPCRALAPHIDRIAKKYEDRLRVVKLNIDTAPTFRERYALLGVPALFLFDGGEVAAKEFGGYPAKIEAMIDKHLASAPPPRAGEPWTPPPPPAMSGGVGSVILPPIDQLVRRR